MSKKITQTAGRLQLGEFAPMFAHLNDDVLFGEVWNEDAIGSEGAVSVHIRHLRQKIEIDPSEPRYLKVVWGQGYKLEDRKERLA